jgi:hypothetical protein
LGLGYSNSYSSLVILRSDLGGEGPVRFAVSGHCKKNAQILRRQKLRLSMTSKVDDEMDTVNSRQQLSTYSVDQRTSGSKVCDSPSLSFPAERG